MKFVKVVSVILAVCLLGCALVACGGDKNNEETTAAETVKVTLTFDIRDGNHSKYKGDITYESSDTITVLTMLDLFCTREDIELKVNERNNVEKIGELELTEGTQYWAAYYEDAGKNNGFAKIGEEVAQNGKTVILYIGEA